MRLDHDQLVDYVRKHAPLAERGSLTRAASKPYDAKYPKIFLTYYSMPDWLDVFSPPGHDRGLAQPHLVPGAPGQDAVHTPDRRVQACDEKLPRQIADALNRIAHFPSGRALLKEVGSTRYSVRVMPYWHYFMTLPGLRYFNAMTKPTMPRETLSNVSLGTRPNDADAAERNSPIRDDGTNRPTRRARARARTSSFFFSAEIWESKDAPKGPGDAPDDTLFHELAHATRMMHGRMTHLPIVGRGGYGNIEEYFATVITNIYLSDKGQTALRGLLQQ